MLNMRRGERGVRFALARMRSSAPAVWRPKFLRPRNEVEGSPRWKTLKAQKSPPRLVRTFYTLEETRRLIRVESPGGGPGVPTYGGVTQDGPNAQRSGGRWADGPPEAPRTLSQHYSPGASSTEVVPRSWTLREYVGQRTAGSPPKPAPLSPSGLEVSSRGDEEGP